MVSVALRTIVFLGLVAVLSPAAYSQQITVGANVQVSKARDKDPHYEVLAEADPTNSNRLIACSMVSTETRYRGSTIVYISTDAAKTWRATLRPDDVEQTGDPDCTFGPDGTAYYVTIATYTGRGSEVLVYRSLDGGESWSSPTKLASVDREFIAFDKRGGKFAGRLYINGEGFVRGLDGAQRTVDISLFRSNDGGLTFAGPVKRMALGKNYVLGMGNSVVLSDGTVVSVFGELKDYWLSEDKGEIRENKPGAANAWLKVIRSEDGGESLTSPNVVDDWYMERNRTQGSHVPMLAVDPGSKPFKDRLYAVWADDRSGRLEILLAHSEDKGRRWSKPVSVNDDRAWPDPAAGPDAITPSIAVNKDGVVGVSWADRREHADNLGYDKRFAASLDGGETFLPSVRVSNVPASFGKNEYWPVLSLVTGGGTPTLGATSNPPTPVAGPLTINTSVHPFFYGEGHTAGLAVDSLGLFHPVWVDNRTGIAQLWTASVSVSGAAARNGALDLAELDDISEKVTLEMNSTHYDRANNELRITAQLRNTSKEALHGPIKVRVITLRSDIGLPQIANPDNDRRAAGAVWDFTLLMKDGRLEAGALSEPKILIFHLTDVRPFRQGRQFKFGLINLDVRVLGKAAKKAM